MTRNSPLSRMTLAAALAAGTIALAGCGSAPYSRTSSSEQTTTTTAPRPVVSTTTTTTEQIRRP